MSVVKLNEAVLYQMGFDRVAIDALRHLFTQVGTEVGATTLPQVTDQVGLVIQTVNALDFAPPAYDQAQHQDDQSPPHITVQAVEHLETQVRSIQEEITMLRGKINDLEQGSIL